MTLWYISYIILGGQFRIRPTKFRVIIYIPETKLLLLPMRKQEPLGNFLTTYFTVEKIWFITIELNFYQGFFSKSKTKFLVREKTGGKTGPIFNHNSFSYIWAKCRSFFLLYWYLAMCIFRGIKIWKFFWNYILHFQIMVVISIFIFPHFDSCLFGLSTWSLKWGLFPLATRRKHHKPSKQSVPTCGHSHSKKVLPDVQRESPIFQFMPVVLFSVT